MDKDKQIINTTVRDIGNSKYILIPFRLISWLELEDVTEVKIITEKGRHGKYLAIWNPEQEEE